MSKTSDRDLLPLLDELGKRGLQSLLVEGGAGIAGEFIDAGLVNKATFFIAPKIVGGVEAPSAVKGIGVELMRDARTLRDVMISQRGDDIEVTGYLLLQRVTAVSDETANAFFTSHRPTKRLGQNFLKDTGVIKRIIESFSPQAGETVD